MAAAKLTPEQEADAQELVRLMEDVAHAKIQEAARLLVRQPTKDLFGQTEFVIRDLVLEIAAQAYEQFLRQKKMATREPG
jgi:hypothetical protein